MEPGGEVPLPAQAGSLDTPPQTPLHPFTPPYTPLPDPGYGHRLVPTPAGTSPAAASLAAAPSPPRSPGLPLRSGRAGNHPGGDSPPTTEPPPPTPGPRPSPAEPCRTVPCPPPPPRSASRRREGAGPGPSRSLPFFSSRSPPTTTLAKRAGWGVSAPWGEKPGGVPGRWEMGKEGREGPRCARCGRRVGGVLGMGLEKGGGGGERV